MQPSCKRDLSSRLIVHSLGSQPEPCLEAGDANQETRRPLAHTVAMKYETRIFGDSVHDCIEIPGLLVSIIDTREVQRLRRISQLGCSSFVYPSANHSRFEHSLGVCHLAGMFARHLKDQLTQEKAGILQEYQSVPEVTDKDVLCVQLAGLCHDLGHGPWSHTFDGWFMPLVDSNMHWKHEDGSIDMLDRILDRYPKIKHGFVESAGFEEKDFLFVKELIAGPKVETSGAFTANNWPYNGRGPEKAFLYEIIANKFTGIDVDKFDYLHRDGARLNINVRFSTSRFFVNARIRQSKQDGLWHICQPDKDYEAIEDLFSDRAKLHKRAYQHKTSIGIQIMFVEAMLKANDHLLFEGANGRMLKLSDTVKDLDAFVRTDEGIFSRILNSNDPNLAESRMLLEKVERRDIYRFVAEITVPPAKPQLALGINRDVSKQLIRISEDLCEKTELPAPLSGDDFVVAVLQIDCGMKTANPVQQLNFYRKNCVDVYKIRGKSASIFAKQNFCQKDVRVYSKNVERSPCVYMCFERWCSLQDMGQIQNFRDFLTPAKSESTSRPGTP